MSNVFQVERAEKRDKKEQFQFQLPDCETTFTMQHPRDLYYRTMIELDYMPEMEQIRALLGDQSEEFEKAAEAIKLDGHQINDLMSAWRKHVGVGSQGETNASSTS